MNVNGIGATGYPAAGYETRRARRNYADQMCNISFLNAFSSIMVFSSSNPDLFKGIISCFVPVSNLLIFLWGKIKIFFQTSGPLCHQCTEKQAVKRVFPV